MHLKGGSVKHQWLRFLFWLFFLTLSLTWFKLLKYFWTYWGGFLFEGLCCFWFRSCFEMNAHFSGFCFTWLVYESCTWRGLFRRWRKRWSRWAKPLFVTSPLILTRIRFTNSKVKITVRNSRSFLALAIGLSRQNENEKPIIKWMLTSGILLPRYSSHWISVDFFTLFQKINRFLSIFLFLFLFQRIEEAGRPCAGSWIRLGCLLRF